MKLVRLGTGQAFRIPTPFGLSRSGGMMFPGKHPLASVSVHGFSDCGSLIGCTLWEYGLLGSRSSLKSPCRIFTEGTRSRPAAPNEEPDSTKWCCAGIRRRHHETD